MEAYDARALVTEFADLQGRLVRGFLAKYQPADTERFRDVPNGTLEEGGQQWEHQRHGAGVTFVSAQNVRVNAHVAMAQHPEAIDGGRLFEFLQSRQVVTVVHADKQYPVTRLSMDNLVEQMARDGVLSALVTGGRFPHRIFELVAGG